MKQLKWFNAVLFTASAAHHQYGNAYLNDGIIRFFISDDEGRSWHNLRVLENAPDHGYAYIAICFNGDLLHLAYSCGGEAECEHMLQNLALTTIKLR